jgi:hypothetical protein
MVSYIGISVVSLSYLDRSVQAEEIGVPIGRVDQQTVPERDTTATTFWPSHRMVILRPCTCSRDFCALSEAFFQGTPVVDLLAAHDALREGHWDGTTISQYHDTVVLKYCLFEAQTLF